MSKKEAKKNDGLEPKLIHLSADTIVKLTIKATKQTPRVTLKEYIQQLCIKDAK